MNYYPEKPILKYQRTSIEMAAVIEYLKSMMIDKEIKRTAYIIFRNESANGKSGINNNYGGFQADSGRWPTRYDVDISGTVIKAENGTGKQRIFLAFYDFRGSIQMLAGRVEARGLYIGGYAHKVSKMRILSPEHLSVAYKQEWVRGDEHVLPTDKEQENFLSMYSQASKLFV